MPNGSRNALMSPASESVRRCSGMLTTAMRGAPFESDPAKTRRRKTVDRKTMAEDFEQEFEDLDVPVGFLQIPAPSVETVAANEEPVAQRRVVSFNAANDFLGHLGNVLRVVDDRDQLFMFVAGDAVQTLEHLVIGNGESALMGEAV